ncbi:MAG: TrkH family potassium uptake protein [Pseudomonadota bacterium]
MGLKSRLMLLGSKLSTPETMLLGGFAFAILIGAILLTTPWAAHPGRVNFVDALFTATSAVCVTGLIVVDTGADFTFWGQVIILVLIQLGGLGIMTFAALAFQMLGRRMSLQSQAVLQETLFQKDLGSQFHQAFRTIIVLTLVIEGLGIIFLVFFLSQSMDPAQAFFSAIFHSVSAFCNAGFSLSNDNLMGLRDNHGVLFVIMTLIILGGLGFSVLHEIWSNLRSSSIGLRAAKSRAFSLHSRVVLWVSTVLVVGGTFFLIAFGLTPDENSWSEKILGGLFQSVTSRTAGFNSVDIGKLPSASLFILIILMFIGGSPGSCAGGVKTSSVAIYLARLVAGLRGKSDVQLGDRRLPHELVSKTDLLMALALFWNIIGVLILLTTESRLQLDSLSLIFEQVSAFGTVGLSTGLTPNLSVYGKLWLVCTMFVGRLGPLSVAFFMVPKTTVRVKYPQGTVMIG